MLGDITIAKEIYMACGYTDMRKSIDGLAAVVQQQFQLDPFQPALFLFCGRRCDRIKALLWEGDGFVLLYKRLENGRYQWPRSEKECRPLSWQECKRQVFSSIFGIQNPAFYSPLIPWIGFLGFLLDSCYKKGNRLQVEKRNTLRYNLM